MRSAKECGNFPYSSGRICYIAVDGNGNAAQLDHSFTSITAAYHNAVSQQVRIYAVWPGQYRSDLFEIDDLNAFADAFGVVRPDDHVHKLNGL